MIQSLGSATEADLEAYPDIIDVRSPTEFAEDHVPGAVNLPVLDDAQRAEVGMIYVRRSRFEARKIGAAIVARNIAVHLEGALSDKTPAFAPLIYCWRGGQRSAAMAAILDQVGWRPTLLVGGYRTYRRAVNGRLATMSARMSVVLLGGHTGTAKTAMLTEVRARGGQVLDLEDLANHRGSLLGRIANAEQPSQKMFESRLAVELGHFDPSRPVLIEAESSKIGQINVPEGLWKAMSGAPMIEVQAPVVERARYLVDAYRDLTENPFRLADALNRLPGRHGRETLSRWRDLAGRGDYRELALCLMRSHYDPAYSRWSRGHPHPRLADINLDDLTPSSIAVAASQIAKLLASEVIA